MQHDNTNRARSAHTSLLFQPAKRAHRISLTICITYLISEFPGGAA